VLALAGGVLAGDQPDERHELCRGFKAGEVADLDDDAQRAEGVDAAQAAKLGDQLAPRSLLGRLANRALEGHDAAHRGHPGHRSPSSPDRPRVNSIRRGLSTASIRHQP
jgi:hypothetical protein